MCDTCDTCLVAIDFNSCPWLRGGICGAGPSHRFSDTARDITSSITMVVTGELTTQSDVLGFVLPRSHMCWAFVFSLRGISCHFMEPKCGRPPLRKYWSYETRPAYNL